MTIAFDNFPMKKCLQLRKGSFPLRRDWGQGGQALLTPVCVFVYICPKQKEGERERFEKFNSMESSAVQWPLAKAFERSEAQDCPA